MKKVILFSGPIHSGKTTCLQKFVSENICDGIIAPIKDGKRFIQRIKSGEIKSLDTDSSDSIKIGKHKFSKETFEWSKQQILESRESEIDYLVIDEIGMLELANSGYEPAVSKTINYFANQNNFDLILVVRESLLEDVIQKYKLGKCEIVYKNSRDFRNPES